MQTSQKTRLSILYKIGYVCEIPWGGGGGEQTHSQPSVYWYLNDLTTFTKECQKKYWSYGPCLKKSTLDVVRMCPMGATIKDRVIGCHDHYNTN